jgi:MtfA peptidase
MPFSWIFNRRRNRLVRKSIDGQWRRWIEDNLWHWHVLDEAQRDRLSGMIQVFVAEKNFEGCDGLVVSDEMKVTIAAAACLLLVGFEDTYCFDRARTILVFPNPTKQRNIRRIDGVVDEFQWLSGMVQQGGPIILSWRDVLRDCRSDQRLNNVVIHEFAHYIDGLDGAMEGVPPLPSQELQQRWKAVADRELKHLRQSVDAGMPTVLDPYGRHSLAELFAVSTESFYCDGLNLYHHHPEIYEMLVILYRMETKGWFRVVDPQGELT